MQLLVNDTVLFDGNEQECMNKLDDMIKDAIYGSLKTIVNVIEQDSVHAIIEVVRYPELGQVYWHIEPTPNGGVFDTSPNTDLF